MDLAWRATQFLGGGGAAAAAAAVRGHTATIRRSHTTATVCLLSDPVLVLTVSPNIHHLFGIAPPPPREPRTHETEGTLCVRSVCVQIITVTAGHLSRMQDVTAAAVACHALHPLSLCIVGDE